MRHIHNAPPTADGLILTTVERTSEEDLHATVGDQFYSIRGQVFSGHDINGMQHVAWDSVAQEWKVVR
jgi:hypothetical protein